MSIITVTSLKGGVGKTTTAIHLAHGLARAGYQTLLIDCDVSSNASRFLGVARDEGEPGVLDLFAPPEWLGAEKTENSLSLRGVSSKAFVFDIRKNLDLVPGTRSMRFKDYLAGQSQADTELYLANCLQFLKQSYSFIILDTSPDLNIMTRSALKACSWAVVPVDAGSLSLEALNDLFECSKTGAITAQVLILRTLVDRRASRTNTIVLDRLSQRLGLLRNTKNGAAGYPNDLKFGVLETVIHRAELANQLSFMQKTAFDIPNATSILDDYARLVEEIIYFWSLTKKTAPNNVHPIQEAVADL